MAGDHLRVYRCQDRGRTVKILTKPIEELLEADLQELVDGAVEERRQLDYKRELPGQTPKHRREFLCDASSFANSGGGAILFGIPESGGVPTSLAGLEGNPDEAVQRLDSMLLSGIDPRPRVDVKSIPLSSGRFVIVVRVPRSFTAPHMVTFDGAQRFYARKLGGPIPAGCSPDPRCVYRSRAASRPNPRLSTLAARGDRGWRNAAAACNGATSICASCRASRRWRPLPRIG